MVPVTRHDGSVCACGTTKIANGSFPSPVDAMWNRAVYECRSKSKSKSNTNTKSNTDWPDTISVQRTDPARLPAIPVEILSISNRKLPQS
mmetsp:Transcript_27592/g.64742  ORF Transcript_27592/g.64742 Transcript_27592/m.64742 type:complete len:90 (+) Transcript_27592:2956-3225(+)